jgi:hypothetical protein
MRRIVMKHSKPLAALAILICITALSTTVNQAALAQSGPGYELSWWTVDGGGVTPNDNSGYTLGGTSGQPDAAVWSGGDYVLAGGFWGGVAVEYFIYLPLVLRGT